MTLEGRLRQFEQPGANHAAVVPEPRQLDQVEAEGRGLQDFESLGVGLKHRVFDAVVDHLRVVAGTGRADIRIAVRRRQRLEDRFRLLEDRFGAADHQAEADLESPDPAADPDVQKLDLLGAKVLGTADRVFVIRIPTVDDDVARRDRILKALDGVVDRRTRRNHHPEDPGRLQFLAEVLEATRSGCTLAGERGNRLRGAVVDRHLVATLEQTLGHAGAHPTEADHAELHQRAPTGTPRAWPIFVSPCATSRTWTRKTRRPWFRRAWKSPRACACLRTPNENFCPGILMSFGSSPTSCKKTPVFGPPLCNWPVEWR